MRLKYRCQSEFLPFTSVLRKTAYQQSRQQELPNPEIACPNIAKQTNNKPCKPTNVKKTLYFVILC